MSPKTFARVARFRGLTESLNARTEGWAVIALEHGFYEPDAFQFSNR